MLNLTVSVKQYQQISGALFIIMMLNVHYPMP